MTSVNSSTPIKGKPRTYSEVFRKESLPLNLSFNDEDSPEAQERKEHPATTKHKNSVDEFHEHSSFMSEDHTKGLYSLGYMEVKMKSNSQWTKLYAKIVRGRLLFFKSIKVS